MLLEHPHPAEGKHGGITGREFGRPTVREGGGPMLISSKAFYV